MNAAGERFEVDGRAVGADVFRLASIDPAASVVVDACAGSGKTTLLVTRIVRALIEGCEPDQVLAVTFTRLAAHEMRERLDRALRELALADDATLHVRLAGWYGLGEAGAEAAAPRARGLYEAVLRHPRGPEITTFHRWFRTLAAIGPLSADSGDGTQLSEEGASLLQQAWFGWLDMLRAPARAAEREDLQALVDEIGLSGARACLESLVAQRTDWAVALDADLDGPREALDAAAQRAAHAYLQVWRDAARDFVVEGHALVGAPTGGATRSLAIGDEIAIDDETALLRAIATEAGLRGELRAFALVLARGSDATRTLALALDALADRDCADDAAARVWLGELHATVLTARGEPRVWRPSKALDAALEAGGGAAPLDARWQALCGRVANARALLDEWRAVGLNAAAMRCGVGLLDMFRRTKRAQGVIDFADLEAIAWRMLRDPGTAAYVQCRMDRRYRHLLFDEFQDTSSLQWRVIADWLQSYAGAGERPSVFVVGDPKQSIYRFRRAEARVFDAAKALLREGFDAREAGTDTTRRNARAIVDVLNRCLPSCMAHYREQATAAAGPPGFAWRLPLVEADAVADTGAEPFDWLTSPRDDEASLRHREGEAIADAILLARDALAAQGRSLSWREVYVLARSRSGFEAYERALRERGLPVQSDRAGGLLRSLEGDDLRALLRFVRRPSDDLALAQVLASPLVGLDAASIAWIAARGPRPAAPQQPGKPAVGSRDLPGDPEDTGDIEDAEDAEDPEDAEAAGDAQAAEDAEAAEDAQAAAAPMPRRWWPRLRRLAAEPDPTDPSPFDVAAVLALVAGWVDAAARAPVHDFLDAVLSQVDAFARYPSAVEPAQREVAHANLCAMLGLALDVDAGRYPSLARFLRRLRGFDTLEEREGPSEGRADAVDAIRMMTIHGSKGLEADLVVLADAHGRAQPDGQRLHVDWSPELPRPSQVSFVLGAALAGRARRESFEREQALREREDRNLLYVALTRARLGVIVSGTRNRNSPKASWYTFLEGVEAPPGWAGRMRVSAQTEAAADAPFPMRLLQLSRLDVGIRRDPDEGGAERDRDGRPAGLLATELGHALHRALELLPAGADEDTVLAALHAFEIDDAQRRTALARARAVMALAPLAPAFERAAPAACEFEIIDAGGEARRIDRIARVGDEAWIIDYKWSVDAARLPEYVVQLAGYRALLEALVPPPLGPVRRLRTVLVDAATGRVWFDVDLGGPDRGPLPGD